LNEDPPRPSARLPKEVGELEAVAALRGVSGRALQREVSADLDWIVMKALAKEPERRYSTASEFVADLRRYLADEPVTARPPSRSYQAAKFARRHRASLAAATVMLVLLVVGSIGTTIGWRRSVNALEVAREQESLARSAEAEAAKQARRAQEEAELALAINEFLNHDLLSAVSPEVMGYDVSMATVLDAAASKIEGRFDSSPRIEHSIRTTLGRTYRTLGRMAQAEEQLLAALAVHPARSATEGELIALEVADVIALGSARSELARVLLQENRNAEAEEVLRALWEECSSVLGEEAPQTIEALHYLGVSLGEQERFDEAGEAFDAALAHALSALGPDHELTIEALHSQGLLRSSRVNADGSLTERERGSLNEEAQGFLGDALRASRSAYGPDDPRSVRHSMSLASAKFTAGHEAEALKLFEDAYERSRRVQGPEHPTTASAAVAIGKIHLAAGSLTLAEPRLQEAFEATLQLGDVHPVHLHSCYSLATCWLRMGRSEDAERLALSMFEALEREGQPVGTAAMLLAEICADSGRYDEAEHWEGLGH